MDPLPNSDIGPPAKRLKWVIYWKDLLPELISVIAGRVNSIPDYFSFRAVCRSWRKGASFGNFDRISPRIPHLMFVGENGNRKLIIQFFDLGKNKAFSAVNLSNVHCERHLSSRGWIFCIGRSNTPKVYLTHPKWPTKINFPDLSTLPKFDQAQVKGWRSSYFKDLRVSKSFVSKMVSTDSPSIKTDLVAIVIWGEEKQLGFSRPGDSSWSLMSSWENKFDDILVYNEKVYAIDAKLNILEYNIPGENVTTVNRSFSLPAIDDMKERNLYTQLMESMRKILIVLAESKDYGANLEFRLFELDLMVGSVGEIYDLGNRTVFLGGNSSLCLDVSEFGGVRPNCIYMTNRRVYNVHEKQTDYFFGEFESKLRSLNWVIPTF